MHALKNCESALVNFIPIPWLQKNARKKSTIPLYTHTHTMFWKLIFFIIKQKNIAVVFCRFKSENVELF